MAAPPLPTSITQIFGTNSVKQLYSSDFRLNDPDKIGLKNDECIVILFYSSNAESIALANIWSQVGQEAAGPILAACDIVSEKAVALAMTSIKSMGNHPFHWASMRGYPFILSYRDGWPAAFYNGDRSVQAILNWVITLACQANYYERFDIYGGVQTTNTLEMPNPTPYPSPDGSNPIRNQSTEYRTAAPLRANPVAGGGVRGGAAPTGVPAAGGGVRGGTAPVAGGGVRGGATPAAGTPVAGPRVVGPT